MATGISVACCIVLPGNGLGGTIMPLSVIHRRALLTVHSYTWGKPNVNPARRILSRASGAPQARFHPGLRWLPLVGQKLGGLM